MPCFGACWRCFCDLMGACRRSCEGFEVCRRSQVIELCSGYSENECGVANSICYYVKCPSIGELPAGPGKVKGQGPGCIHREPCWVGDSKGFIDCQVPVEDTVRCVV